jgi:DNA-directed RNA polymerase subunit RPC12/RpoP
MSEFKFSCPVCGQHIAADSSATGAQIECPTCFQKIIIPEAPKADSKYILSATQYIKSPPLTPPRPPDRSRAARKSYTPVLAGAAAVVVAIGATFYLLQSAGDRPGGPKSPAQATNAAGPARLWSLDFADANFPDDVAAGRIHGHDFSCQRAVVQYGSLALRQGSGYRPDLVVNVFLPAHDAADLIDRHFNIRTNEPGPLPHVVLRWKQGELQVSQAFTNGYMMKLEFGQANSTTVPGRIYLCLPDASKSVVAGTFIADIRRPSSPRRP